MKNSSGLEGDKQEGKTIICQDRGEVKLWRIVVDWKAMNHLNVLNQKTNESGKKIKQKMKPEISLAISKKKFY